MSQFTYRSLSFHGIPRPSDFDLIRLGARLGFTDVAIQLEGKNSVLLPRLAEECRANGFFDLLRELGLTLSVWTHEISERSHVIGALEPGNEALWQAVRDRYTHYLTQLLPEVDHWLLTVVETEINLTERHMLGRLVREILSVCRAHGKRLVLRTFVHEPEELQEVRAVVADLPADVIIQSKYVPQDWHLRAGPDPLIGQCGSNPQWVELDVCGEYFRNTHLPNCMGQHLQNHYRTWRDAGIEGISVRVDRRARPKAWWEPMVRDHSIWGTPLEFNLFALASLARGGDLAQAWETFSRHYTGNTAINLRPVLDATGAVVEESLCVGREPFGGRTDVPCEWSMNGEHAATGETRAQAYPDAEDTVYRSPFHYKYSAFRWDPSLAPEYHAMRKGQPTVIEQKARNSQAARLKALNSLQALARVQPQMEPALAAYLQFLLEENLWHLDVMTHCALAWMKAAARLYQQPPANQSPEPVEHHLQAITHLAERQATEKLHAAVRGWQSVTLHRGEFLDLQRFQQLFSHFWSRVLP